MDTTTRTNVDLSGLAIDRGGPVAVRARRHIVTRYVLPLGLLLGFLLLIAWAGRDVVFPPRSVTVIPVFSTTAAVRTAGTPLFKAAGWIEPRPTPIRVAALAPGVVESLLVVEDQPVAQGETIAELVKDDARLVAERAAADLRLRKAELAAAKATLAAAQTRYEQPVHLEAALGESEAALAKIDTQLKNLPFETRRAIADAESARKDYESKLASQGVVAGVTIDIAKGKADTAAALVAELEGRIASLHKEQAALQQRRDALQTQLELLADERKTKDEAAAQVQAAEARVAQMQVAAEEAQLQLDRMTIRAPRDGRIYRLIAHPGARIGSGTGQMAGYDGSTVVTMYDPRQLQVRVDVRFEDLPKVTLGQPVTIDNPALREPIQGSVLFISSEADIQKNTLQVKVAIPDAPQAFRPEMLVDATFLSPEPAERTAEPTQELKLYALPQLIQRGENGSFAWVADQSDGVARRVLVDVGEVANNGLVEIKSGLTIASRLILQTEGLQDGMRIRVTGEESAATASSSTPPNSGQRSLQRLPPNEDTNGTH